MIEVEMRKHTIHTNSPTSNSAAPVCYINYLYSFEITDSIPDLIRTCCHAYLSTSTFSFSLDPVLNNLKVKLI